MRSSDHDTRPAAAVAPAEPLAPPLAPVARRTLLGVGAGAGVGTLGAWAASGLGLSAAQAAPSRTASPSDARGIPARALGLTPVARGDAKANRSAAFQRAVDQAAARHLPLLLEPGIYPIANIRLRAGTRLVGVSGATRLRFTGGATFLTALNADVLQLHGLSIDGMRKPLDPDRADGLITLYRCTRVRLDDCTVENSLLHGLALRACDGEIARCHITNIGQAALFSLDATPAGLAIVHNHITACANNGIQVWRSTPAADASRVMHNVIADVESRAGGSGQNGNGINVYRAGDVMVAHNRITGCAYSAIRGNAASNVQMTGNHVANIGEVALYAEFGFEGAMIANNVIDGAASGIAVTNFNDGGRLAVVSGNLIRNLRQRPNEPMDKRGEGLSIEADASVTGNTIEGAPAAAIMIGFGRHMRNVVVTGNMVRDAGVGIGVTGTAGAGACLIAQNMIAGTKHGAIRAMDGYRPYGPDLANQQRHGGSPERPMLPHVSVQGNVTSA
ncbi:MAG: TIGR03808 family TAT-translocated repetitive protein [Pseudomonadota bacterium]